MAAQLGLRAARRLYSLALRPNARVGTHFSRFMCFLGPRAMVPDGARQKNSQKNLTGVPRHGTATVFWGDNQLSRGNFTHSLTERTVENVAVDHRSRLTEI